MLASPLYRRLVLTGVALVVVLCAAGAALHLGLQVWTYERAASQSLLARASAVALAVDGPPAGVAPLFERLAAQDADTDYVLLAPGRTPATATRAGTLLGIDWAQTLAGRETAGVERLVLGERLTRSVVVPVGADGRELVALETMRPADGPPLWPPLLFALAAALLLVAALLAALHALGPRVADRLWHLAERLAGLPGEAETLLRNAEAADGAVASALRPLHARLVEQARDLADVRSHVAGLFQINPHYVLLCTFDGMLVEANPAFYAVTGLPFEAIRGGRIEALREVMPIEPLLELAERSAREGSALTGIEYALVGEDDVSRPVQVSLRAVRVSGRPAVLIQATDVARQRTLERQIATFSDSLDLMVDQRVAQLTAGQASLRRLLDAAGVVVVSFDAGGATRRWSPAAEALTQRPAAQVPHVTAFASALDLPEHVRAEFLRWFWEGGAEAFATEHPAFDAEGQVVSRPVWWRVVSPEAGGRGDYRTLIGFEGPVVPPPSASSGDGHSRMAAPWPEGVPGHQSA